MPRTAAAPAPARKAAIPQLPGRSSRAGLSADGDRLGRRSRIHPPGLAARACPKSAWTFMLPEARDLLKKAGADVAGERVRFDPAMIEELHWHPHRRNSPSMPAIPTTIAQIGGDGHAVRHRGEPAQLLRHGRRPPHRQSGGLPQLPEARAVLQLHRLHRAAIRSSRSISTPRSAISRRCATWWC